MTAIQMDASSQPSAIRPCRRRRFAGFAFLACLIMAFCILPQAAQAQVNEKYASFVMDADTGTILHQRHADKILHPASLTKVVTLLMVFDALREGKITLRDRIVVSNHAASMIPSKLDIPAGSSIRVEDAIYALVTRSANDVAVAVAEHLGGTESGFAAMMNRKAERIGMSRTHFRNASGLHDPRQVSTVRDMARLGQYVLREYPEYYHYFSTRSFTYQGRTHRNHNRLMETYAGMDGLKTGYINASGFNLLATAKRGDRRLIGVVFGGRSTQTRNAHMANLLDRGFDRYDEIMVAQNTGPAPVPPRKPEAPGTRLASAASLSSADTIRWAELAPMLQNKAISRLIGEGDFDPSAIRRFETGFTAISAVKGEPVPDMPSRAIEPAAITPQAGTAGDERNWSIQIGAFSSRVKTDEALQGALQTLPRNLHHGTAVIAPLRTRDGWLFRGRLSGYSQAEATQACARLRECLPVGPHAH